MKRLFSVDSGRIVWYNPGDTPALAERNTRMTRKSRLVVICAAVTLLAVLAPDSLSAYHIFVAGADGKVTIRASAVRKIARKGLMFGQASEIYNVNDLNTYPDYPELGFDTPENRATSDAVAAEINEIVHSAHEDGGKALLWSFEIENPAVLVALHPELACGPGTGWYERREGDRVYKVNGLCLYKKGTREFVQRRFDEILRKCPDVDGFLFSLHESASRPWCGQCDSCKDKTTADRIADTANMLHQCVREAVHKARPGKEPVNYIREHGLSYVFAADKPGKMQEVVDGLSRMDPAVPVVVRPGLGDYFEFMILNPLVRHDELEYPGNRVVGLAERDDHPFILDGAAATRQLDGPACIPVHNGPVLRDYFQAAKCKSFAGWGHTRTRTTGETTCFRLNALSMDTGHALLVDPDLDVRDFTRRWYEREMALSPEAAVVFTDIVIRGYAIDVLSTCVNGTNFPLGATADWRAGTGDYRGIRGCPDRWDSGWWRGTSRHFGTRTSVLWPKDDEEPCVYGFSGGIGGLPGAVRTKKSADEKLAYILHEKRLAVSLARASLRQAMSLSGEAPDELYNKAVDQCQLALWFARAREAQARAFWTWWFRPDMPVRVISGCYREYEKILEEPIPDGFTMSSDEIREDALNNRYWGKSRFEAGVSGFPFPDADQPSR